MVVGAVLSVIMALALDLLIYGAGIVATPWARRARVR